MGIIYGLLIVVGIIGTWLAIGVWLVPERHFSTYLGISGWMVLILYGIFFERSPL